MPLDPPPPPPPGPPSQPPDQPSSQYGAPSASATTGGRSTGARVGIGVGIVALIGIVASLAVALSGSGAGAGSPEDAVRELTDAIADEDIVGAITALPPSEVGSVHELYDPLMELLVRQGALDDDGNPLQGVDIEFHDLDLEPDEMSDDVRKVYLRGGRVTVDVVVDELDDVIRGSSAPMHDVHEEFDLADVSGLLEQANDELGTLGRQNGVETGAVSGLFLMTVREGDRWYVSPTYTFAEIAREALGLPEPDFGSWREQVGPGAESPEAVVDSFAAALSSLDADAVADAIESGEPIESLEVEGALAPGEFAAFFDYMPVFEQWITESGGDFDLAEGSVDTSELVDALRDVEFDITVEVDSDARSIGDRRSKVVVRSAQFLLHANGRIDGQSARTDARIDIYDGLCADISAEALVDGVVEPVEASECLDGIPGTDFDGVFIVTVERDGGWYFSPTETLVEYGRLALDAALAS